jgi:NADH:ubiquinone oxidoreductase subunit 3 (subunit A)
LTIPFAAHFLVLLLLGLVGDLALSILFPWTEEVGDLAPLLEGVLMTVGVISFLISCADLISLRSVVDKGLGIYLGVCFLA